MKAFIVYNTSYDVTILVGSYDSILEYVLDPDNEVIEHYKCTLKEGSGKIVLLARNDNEDQDSVYCFQTAKEALLYMEKNHEWTFTREKVVFLEPDTITASSEDAEPVGLSWQLEQAEEILSYRKAKKISQTQFAVELSCLGVETKFQRQYTQTYISMIERGLKFFPLEDWKIIQSYL